MVYRDRADAAGSCQLSNECERIKCIEKPNNESH